MPYRPNTKQILYVNHYETPCTTNINYCVKEFQRNQLKITTQLHMVEEGIHVVSTLCNRVVVEFP